MTEVKVIAFAKMKKSFTAIICCLKFIFLKLVVLLQVNVYIGNVSGLRQAECSFSCIPIPVH